MQIPHGLGRRAGPNLFHSFRAFNVRPGQSVDFTYDGPEPVARVLARVTGGSPTRIDGTLRSSVPDASFYLMNPAGVVFGPGASADVGGAFAVTTADHLKLADGGRFDAAAPAASVLTTAAPAAFGFLAARPAAIRVAGTPGDPDAPAVVAAAPGRALSVVGGDVSLTNALAGSFGGRTNVVAVGSPGEVDLDAEDPAAAGPVARGFARFGAVALTDGSGLVADAQPDADVFAAGSIVVRGRRVLIDGSRLTGDTVAAAAGGGCRILSHFVAPDPAAPLTCPLC